MSRQSHWQSSSYGAISAISRSQFLLHNKSLFSLMEPSWTNLLAGNLHDRSSDFASASSFFVSCSRPRNLRRRRHPPTAARTPRGPWEGGLLLGTWKIKHCCLQHEHLYYLSKPTLKALKPQLTKWSQVADGLKLKFGAAPDTWKHVWVYVVGEGVTFFGSPLNCTNCTLAHCVPHCAIPKYTPLHPRPLFPTLQIEVREVRCRRRYSHELVHLNFCLLFYLKWRDFFKIIFIFFSGRFFSSLHLARDQQKEKPQRQARWEFVAALLPLSEIPWAL